MEHMEISRKMANVFVTDDDAVQRLIRTDTQMPETDRSEVPRVIREMEKKMDRSVPKPVRQEALFALINRLVRNDAAGFSEAAPEPEDKRMDRSVPKPFRREALFAVIDRLVRNGAAGVSEAASEPEYASSEEPPSRVLDREELDAITGGEPTLIKEMVRLYLQELPKLMSQLRESLGAGDGASLALAAHSLKGMSLNMAAGAVADAASELERIGRSGDLSQAGARYENLEAETEELKNALDFLPNHLSPQR